MCCVLVCVVTILSKATCKVIKLYVKIFYIFCDSEVCTVILRVLMHMYIDNNNDNEKY